MEAVLAVVSYLKSALSQLESASSQGLEDLLGMTYVLTPSTARFMALTLRKTANPLGVPLLGLLLLERTYAPYWRWRDPKWVGGDLVGHQRDHAAEEHAQDLARKIASETLSKIGTPEAARALQDAIETLTPLDPVYEVFCLALGKISDPANHQAAP